MKKIFFAFAAITLMAGPALAQEKPAAKKKATKETSCHKEGSGESCCKEEQTAKGKSCCMPMPSRAAAAKTKAAKPAARAEKAKPAPTKG